MYSRARPGQGRGQPGPAGPGRRHRWRRGTAFARIETPDHYRAGSPAGALFEYPDAKAPRYARERAGGRGHQPHGQPLPRPGRDDGAAQDAGAAGRAPRGGASRPRIRRSAGSPCACPAARPPTCSRGDVRLADADAPRARGSEADLVATARRFSGRPLPVGRDERPRHRLLGAHQPRLRRQRDRPAARRRHAVRRSARAARRARARCARATSCSSARRRSRTSGCTSATAASSTPPPTPGPTCTRNRWTTPTGSPLYRGARRPQ